MSGNKQSSIRSKATSRFVGKQFTDEVKLVLRLFYINCQKSGDFELQLGIAAVKIAGLIDKQLANKDEQIEKYKNYKNSLEATNETLEELTDRMAEKVEQIKKMRTWLDWILPVYKEHGNSNYAEAIEREMKELS